SRRPAWWFLQQLPGIKIASFGRLSTLSRTSRIRGKTSGALSGVPTRSAGRFLC
ncbi:unnamed protein product, partial [Ascophyllum nodosum]